jgi:hypothetical protein
VVIVAERTEPEPTGRLTQREVEVRRPQDARASRHDWHEDDVTVIEEGDSEEKPKK